MIKPEDPNIFISVLSFFFLSFSFQNLYLKKKPLLLLKQFKRNFKIRTFKETKNNRVKDVLRNFYEVM